ncbi:MAG: radical SAM protein, partial [Rhodospirillales bacterium]|nr:radical SAM protein [Rhodospirillales bacterium]
MSDTNLAVAIPLDGQKFRDWETTAKGEPRAFVALTRFRTLWINTGSLCNLTCAGCYIESSPTNDRLVYISANEVRSYLDEIRQEHLPVEEIGFTGGEPFMNRELPAMIEESLAGGFRVLVLTNAMKPMHHCKAQILALKERYGNALRLRVSLDHFDVAKHENLRGPKTWQPTMDGLRWLVKKSFAIDIAGRTIWDEPEESLREGYQRLFERERIPIDARDPSSLV